MKREQIEGVAENIAGKAQSAVGRLIDDPALEAEGEGRQAAGQVTKTYGDAVNCVSSFVKEKPFATVAIGAALAMVVSRLLRR